MKDKFMDYLIKEGNKAIKIGVKLSGEERIKYLTRSKTISEIACLLTNLTISELLKQEVKSVFKVVLEKNGERFNFGTFEYLDQAEELFDDILDHLDEEGTADVLDDYSIATDGVWVLRIKEEVK